MIRVGSLSKGRLRDLSATNVLEQLWSILRGSSWNRVGKIGVSGREHARARKRERTRKSVVTRPEGKV